MKKGQRKFLFLCLIVFSALFLLGGLTTLVSAQTNDLNFGLQPVAKTGLSGTDIRVIIAQIIRAVLGLLGIIALGIVIYGGWMYMTAAGNEDKVATAKKILVNGLIGLVIILSSFAIVQFVLNKLAEATGYGGSAGSEGEADPIPGWPDFCQKVPDHPSCCPNEFFVKSITPVSSNTGMNNIGIRVLFNKPLAEQYTADDVFDVFSQGEITNQFDYVFFKDIAGKINGVDALYKSGQSVCPDDEGPVPCLEYGNYKVKVRGDLKSADGQQVAETTKCGSYPLEAGFSVKADSLNALNFTGNKDAISAGLNPISQSALTLEAWVYPTVKNTGYIFGVGSTEYYLRILDNNDLHFRLGTSTPALGGGLNYFFCDARTPKDSVSLNKWNHIVATYDPTLPAKRQKIYIDGVLQGETYPGKDYDGCVDYGLYKYNLTLGAIKVGKDTTNPWKGYLSSLCLYNEPLTPEQIKAHYNQGPGKECVPAGTKSLKGGWLLNEGQGTLTKDFSGNNQNGQIAGAAWITLNKDGSILDKVIDKQPPQVSDLLIKGPEDDDGTLLYNKGYTLENQITDDHGLGYTYLKLEKMIDANQKETILDYYHGPAVTRPGGSDVPAENPFAFLYPFKTPTSTPGNKIQHYVATLEVWDIDHNRTIVNTAFSLGEYNPDGSCQYDWECESGDCQNGVCVLRPKIIDAYPLSGAAGNYVTLVGKYFGTKIGKVEFAQDTNKDGEYDEKDNWVAAVVVKCENEISWHNTYVIVSVPEDVSLPLESTSSLRLTRGDANEKGEDAAGNPLWDTTTNEVGPKPGKNSGLFIKTTEKLPGLCAVRAQVASPDDPTIIMEVTKAVPQTPVKGYGDSLGVSADNKTVRFGGVIDPKTGKMSGGVQAPFNNSTWTAKKFDSEIPANLAAGTMAVYVTVNGQPSNGVPFTVLGDKTGMKYPNISEVDPDKVTRKSFVTIYGTDFGSEKGLAMIGVDKGKLSACLGKNLIDPDNDGKIDCYHLNLTDLPDFCGETWQDQQIIALVTEDIPNSSYYLGVRDFYGYQTIFEDGKLEVIDGNPLPSICLLNPNQGQAPLPKGSFLSLAGINFAPLPGQNNSQVYFWRDGASNNSLAGWLKREIVVDNDALPGMGIGEMDVAGNHLKTDIPIDENDGKSMKTGSIKVWANGQTGNSVKYTVIACQEASEKEKKSLETELNLACCESAGIDQGQWKTQALMCAGDSRTGGYVWRFTTGQIKDWPYVLETCNEVDWDNPGVSVDYPSPVPSTIWSRGREACLNSQVAVRFSTTMAVGSFTDKTVKMFKCAQGEGEQNPNCNDKKISVPLLWEYKEAGQVLELNGFSLEPFTWYRVELGKDIYSQVKFESYGETEIKTGLPLVSTKSCGAGTAYCFEFKTGNENCILKAAGIIPESYTVHLLGLILNPGWPVAKNIPLYYYVWGRGEQECSVINVDGLGWQWEATDSNKAAAAKAPLLPKYSDTRATVTAKAETIDKPVFITASVDELLGIFIMPKLDILKEINGQKPIVVNSPETIFKIAHIPEEDYVGGENYAIEIGAAITDLDPLTDPGFYEIKADPNQKEVDAWVINRYLYEKPGIVKFYTEETYFPDKKRERKYHYQDLFSGLEISYTQAYKPELPGAWLEYQARIEKKNGKLSFSLNGNKTGAVGQPSFKNPAPVFSGEVGIGGSTNDIPGGAPLFGEVNRFIIQKAGQNIKEKMTATSTLSIILSAPQVEESWPNCIEACISSLIGARFDRPMYQPSYGEAGAIEVRRCGDESCQAFVDAGTDWEADLQASSETILRLKPKLDSYLLEPNSWYLVTIKGGNNNDGKLVRSLGSFDAKDPAFAAGKPLEKDFQWKFRTKNDASPCAVDSVKVSPDPFLAVRIGEKNKYLAVPHSQPDQCSSVGQELNPWWYGWDWQGGKDIEDPTKQVAVISDFASYPVNNPACGSLCTLAGSDIANDPGNDQERLCGNGVLDAGEDCDLTAQVDSQGNNVNEQAGKTCTLNCLRPGNTVINGCGDGVVNPNLGEECDPKVDSFCTTKCTWVGSGPAKPEDPAAPFCGSGTKTSGEECDLNDPATALGCSASCLHAGTPLSQIWCDTYGDIVQISGQKAKDTAECKQAISVCGNKILESGEECEVMGESILRVQGGEKGTAELFLEPKKANDYCSKQCLLVNLCDLESNTLKDFGLKCQVGGEGCNPDCTWAGSSLIYSKPSLCGDEEVGIGEYAACETDYPTPAGWQSLGQNPVQLATAIGQGTVDEVTKKQKTEIKATVIAFRDAANKKFSLNPGQQKTGIGEYNLQCGYTENSPYPEAGSLNDCPTEVNEDKVKWGVANNSCCYERPQRQAEFPVHNQGVADQTEPVCRNTYIKADFDQEIDPASIKGDVVVALGYADENYDCEKNEQTTVTDLVKQALALNSEAPSKGFWQKLWGWVGHFFASLFGQEVKADQFDLAGAAKVWCSGKVQVESAVTNLQADGQVTSTVSLFLQDLLPANTPVAIWLRGGNSGLTTVSGIGIRNPHIDSLDDSWVFVTSDKICKLTDVMVEPASFLFTLPEQSQTFLAAALSSSNQPIVPIPGQYAWSWDWQPQANEIFAIPAVGSPADKPVTKIASRNVEGKMVGVANALITEDVDISEENQLGQTFTGLVDLQAEFCENPWPSPAKTYPFKEGLTYTEIKEGLDNTSGFDALGNFDGSALPTVNSEYLNFSLSYCADAGVSGDKTDDLPYLKPKLFLDYELKNKIPQPSFCQYKADQVCQTEADCPLAYNVPYNNPPHISGFIAGCETGTSMADLQTNNCQTFVSPTGKYCYKNNSAKPYPPQYGSTYRSCAVDQDCEVGIGEICKDLLPIWKVPGSQACAQAADVVETEFVDAIAEDKVLKRFLFFNDLNDDVIGLQVFTNEKHFSPADWYNKGKSEGGQGFTGTIKAVDVGGREAVTDGVSYYVAALNETADKKNIYSNIYQLTLNENAQANTQEVFNQLLSGLSFNINISDFGYCGKDLETPDFTYVKKICTSDLDCWQAKGYETIKESQGNCKHTGELCVADLNCPGSILLKDIPTDQYFCYALDNTKGGSCPNGFAECNKDTDATCLPTTDKYSVPATALFCYGDDGAKKGQCANGVCGVGEKCLPDTTLSVPVDYLKNTCVVTENAQLLEHTAPICANARTKMNRDWQRVGDIAKIQDTFASYFAQNKAYPILDSGTFIKSYTVSRWPSWGKLGAQLGSSLPLEEINDWRGCDSLADQQTCWKPAEQIYSCPAKSLVYEYEAKNNGASYLLHGPLEYFTPDLQFAKDYVDFDYYSLEPWCLPNTEVSPLQEKCGNGVINAGEQCEPPNKTYVSNYGQKTGCVAGYLSSQWDKSCSEHEDDQKCGYYLNKSTIKGGTTYSDSDTGLCAWMGNQIRDAEMLDADSDSLNYVFGCSHNAECLQSSLYLNRARNGSITIDGKTIAADKHDINSWLSNSASRIKCEPVSNYFDVVKPVACEQTWANCPTGQISSKTCTATCQWSYGTCQSATSCGNGKVEGQEVCDDGVLNGSYGHCNDKCTGSATAKCGNGYIDFNEEGNPLETCEQVDQVQISYQQPPAKIKGTRLACDAFVDSLPINQPTLLKWREGCAQWTGHCEKDHRLVCNQDQDCWASTSQQVINLDWWQVQGYFTNTWTLYPLQNYGPCKKDAQYGSQYNFLKQNSCSWDCQASGGYCGDGVKEIGQEQCEDGNQTTQDGCNNRCQVENIACKLVEPFFTTSTAMGYRTDVYLNDGIDYKDLLEKLGKLAQPDKHGPLIAACKANDKGQGTGDAICRAYGLECNKVEVLGASKIDFQEIVFDVDKYQKSCAAVLSETIFNDQPYRAVCDGVYLGAGPKEKIESEEVKCGDGVVQNGSDVPADQKEVCDLGKDKNGQVCQPAYGQACSYCSTDCKEVLYVDPVQYCGNNKLDFVDLNGDEKYPPEALIDPEEYFSQPLDQQEILLEVCDGQSAKTWQENDKWKGTMIAQGQVDAYYNTKLQSIMMQAYQNKIYHLLFLLPNPLPYEEGKYLCADNCQKLVEDTIVSCGLEDIYKNKGGNPDGVDLTVKWASVTDPTASKIETQDIELGIWYGNSHSQATDSLPMIIGTVPHYEFPFKGDKKVNLHSFCTAENPSWNLKARDYYLFGIPAVIDETVDKNTDLMLPYNDKHLAISSVGGKTFYSYSLLTSPVLYQGLAKNDQVRTVVRWWKKDFASGKYNGFRLLGNMLTTGNNGSFNALLLNGNNKVQYCDRPDYMSGNFPFCGVSNVADWGDRVTYHGDVDFPVIADQPFSYESLSLEYCEGQYDQDCRKMWTPNGGVVVPGVTLYAYYLTSLNPATSLQSLYADNKTVDVEVYWPWPNGSLELVDGLWKTNSNKYTNLAFGRPGAEYSLAAADPSANQDAQVWWVYTAAITDKGVVYLRDENKILTNSSFIWKQLPVIDSESQLNEEGGWTQVFSP